MPKALEEEKSRSKRKRPPLSRVVDQLHAEPAKVLPCHNKTFQISVDHQIRFLSSSGPLTLRNPWSRRRIHRDANVGASSGSRLRHRHRGLYHEPQRSYRLCSITHLNERFRSYGNSVEVTEVITPPPTSSCRSSTSSPVSPSTAPMKKTIKKTKKRRRVADGRTSPEMG